jgi:subtilisin-like proprotein convertase family protein
MIRMIPRTGLAILLTLAAQESHGEDSVRTQDVLRLDKAAPSRTLSMSTEAIVPVGNRETFSGTGPGGPIADGSDIATPGAPALSTTVTVPIGFTGPISDVWVELDGLQHTWAGDLRARLIHPDGVTSVDLFSRPGRGSSNAFGIGSDFGADNSYSFSDNATILFGISEASPLIPTGIYRPSSNQNPPDSSSLDDAYTPMSFALTFGGKRAAGEWTLEITDWAAGDVGSLEGWTLHICTGGCPAKQYSLGDELFKLTAYQPDRGWEFGHAVALSGETAIIGSPSYSGAGSFSAGSAYLFDVTTGRQLALLPPSDDIGEFVRFGYSVALSGHTALVGALYDRVDAVGAGFATGSVYVFEVSNPSYPVQRRKLIPSDATGDFTWEFGSSVAISGNVAVVGAPGGGALLSRTTGAVYLFDVHSGRELAKLTASDGALGDGYGSQLAISGNTVLVSAPFQENDTGAVYVVDVSDPRHPVERFKLTASDTVGGPRFGGSIALSGNRALVGAAWGSGMTPSAGAAYLFDVTTGQQLAKLTASDGMAGDGFGWSVAIDGDTALVGSPFVQGPDDGAYLFDVSNPLQPVELSILRASDAQPNDWYGWSVALEGGTAIVGSTQTFTGAGKAFLYRGRSSPSSN